MTCSDPALTSDFTLPGDGLCSHGGPVAHANETFALVWDPRAATAHDYAAPYVEQFLRDVADGSGRPGLAVLRSPRSTRSGRSRR